MSERHFRKRQIVAGVHEALLSTLVHARTEEINARTTAQRNNIMNFIFFFSYLFKIKIILYPGYLFQ